MNGGFALPGDITINIITGAAVSLLQQVRLCSSGSLCYRMQPSTLTKRLAIGAPPGEIQAGAAPEQSEGAADAELQEQGPAGGDDPAQYQQLPDEGASGSEDEHEGGVNDARLEAFHREQDDRDAAGWVPGMNDLGGLQYATDAPGWYAMHKVELQ